MVVVLVLVLVVVVGGGGGMILGEVKARPKDIISFSLDYISKSKVQTSNPSSSPISLDTPARPADFGGISPSKRRSNHNKDQSNSKCLYVRVYLAMPEDELLMPKGKSSINPSTCALAIVFRDG